MSQNMVTKNGDIKNVKGKTLKKDEHFKNIWSYMCRIENVVMIWTAKAWSALNRLTTIWRSSLPDTLKKQDS